LKVICEKPRVGPAVIVQTDQAPILVSIEKKQKKLRALPGTAAPKNADLSGLNSGFQSGKTEMLIFGSCRFFDYRNCVFGPGECTVIATLEQP
jgi:hypothetical protein